MAVGPGRSKNHLNSKFCDIKIVQDGWNKKHAKSIRLAYRKAPFFAEYIDPIEAHLLGKNYTHLTDLAESSSLFLDSRYAVELNKASDFDFGTSPYLVLDMCLKLHAQKFIFGEQGKNYADWAVLDEVRPYFQKYVHPTYRQYQWRLRAVHVRHRPAFNVGPDSKAAIMRGNTARVDYWMNAGIASSFPSRNLKPDNFD